MSRIRSVHPGFFRDENLVACSAFARLLFIGLGVEADDKGIFEWKPVTIKMTVFPGDNVDVVALLSELEGAGSIRQYEIGGRKYGAIRNFRKFQRPKTPNDIHPTTSEIATFIGLAPAVSETDEAEADAFPQKGEKSPQMEEGGGREGGKDAKPTASLRATRWQKGQKVPDGWKAWAKANFPSVEAYKLTTETRQFEEYWPTKLGKDGLRADFEAEYHMWMRRKFGPQEVPDAGEHPTLVVLRPNDNDFKLLEALRGKPYILGNSGTVTVTTAEVARAREITGMEMH